MLPFKTIAAVPSTDVAFVFAAANGSFVKIADYLKRNVCCGRWAVLWKRLTALRKARWQVHRGFADCVGYLAGGQGRTAGIAIGNADIGIQYGFASSELRAVLALHI